MAKEQTLKQIEQYEHSDKERANNPHVGLVTPASDPDTGEKKTYQYDPHLDPQLQWAGKAEHTSFEVPTVSLHVHERIDPNSIIDTVKKVHEGPKQMSLFETNEKPLREAIDFYKHKENWSNRLIAGDSLLVMNSLLEKEGMAGKVQMVFFDPPYGISYKSNFQAFVNKRDVKEKDEDLTSEPEMLKAFRDTWELGIHSYLTYIRDRMLLAKELLDESGSVFIQISDENVHLIRSILDEVFNRKNEVATIVWKKGTPISKTIRNSFNYLLWYAKDKDKVKSRKIFFERTGIEGTTEDPRKLALWGDFANNETRTLTTDEKRNIQLTREKANVFRVDKIIERGDDEDKRFEFEFEGKKYTPDKGYQWRGDKIQMQRLLDANRILKTKDGFGFKFYITDYPIVELTNLWDDTAGNISDMIYVVQTNEKIIQRCLMMTTDPGDLLLDITCGSGTTAFVAEQYGRRWITCDTSRVALTLTKQRLMTANFDYYELAYPNEGVGSGFKYNKVPHITLKSIANNENPPEEILVDKPIPDNRKQRVTGPFTVEAVPAPYAKSFDDLENVNNGSDTSIARTGETLRQSEWRDELQKSGVRAKGGNIIHFTRVEPLAGTKYLQAEAETKEDTPKKVLVVFGPEHAPLEQRMVENAWQEARALKPDMLLFCAFQFDEEAAKDIDELTPAIAGMQLLKAQMNADMLTDDLRKSRSSNESFWLVGQPDVEVYRHEFLVFSDKVIASYDIFKELSGLNSLAEINKLGNSDLLLYLILSQGRSVWHYLANEAGWDINPGKYSRGTGKAKSERVQSFFVDSSGFVGRVRDFYNNLEEFGISDRRELPKIADRLLGNKEITLQLEKIAEYIGIVKSFPFLVDSKNTENLKPSTENLKLSTKNYSQVEVMGFDYYNPKTGNVESGGKKNIAMWMLDTDYDNRSLFPSQVFFPMAGAGDGWDKLAKNLKAEIDEEKIESFKGTLSLEFKPGSSIAVKIIDDRGIESLRVIKM